MFHFFKKIIVFCIIPLLVVWIIEIVLLPINFFNHRNWEALQVHSKIPHYGPFYSNQNIESVEVGDLAFATKLAVPKKTKWITDSLGFRNNTFIKNPDIIIIGDSFIAGTSLSQEHTFTNQLSKLFNDSLQIYNLAPSNFSSFDELIKINILKKPKILIYSHVERTVPELFVEKPFIDNQFQRSKSLIRKIKIAEEVDLFTRFYSLKWLAAKIKKSNGQGVISSTNKKFLFHKEEITATRTTTEINNSINAILSYQKYCNKNNIKFIYMPIPNKETIFFDWISLQKQPDYLKKLNQKLITNNIPIIDVLALFNLSRKNNQIVYHYDDTHWNKLGVSLVAKCAKNQIDIKKKLDEKH
jgi:alginate O-acetyltransferase complex protein AlgJ